MKPQIRGNPVTAALDADASTGLLFQATHTMGAADVATTFTIPKDVRGFRLTPVTNDVSFAVGETPANAIATTSGAAVTVSSAFSIGNTAQADVTETRLLPPQEGATLRTLVLKDPTNASTVVFIEFFG